MHGELDAHLLGDWHDSFEEILEVFPEQQFVDRLVVRCGYVSIRACIISGDQRSATLGNIHCGARPVIGRHPVVTADGDTCCAHVTEELLKARDLLVPARLAMDDFVVGNVAFDNGQFHSK
jgi:hypothetical protein